MPQDDLLQQPQSAAAGQAFGPIPSGTVTFLFTDIEASTRLLQETGAGYVGLLGDHRRLLRAAFAAQGGREIDTQGDSFFVAFARPSQAVAAAAEAQRTLAVHPWPPGHRVRVRMGTHTGEAAEVDGTYVALAVHRAARIAAAAHGGQVVLSQVTADLVREGLESGASLRDLGEHRLKDFPRAAHLYQLDIDGLPGEFPALRAALPADRLPSAPGAFVGRDHDVEAVAALLKDVRTRLVTLTGPGGIGKTRLAVEAARLVKDSFPGGVVFVPLAAVVDPGLVLSTLAEAVGVRRETGVPLLDAVSSAIGERRRLLFLDNFEQVVDATPEVAALLDQTPVAVALVTSRQVLRLRSEQQYPVAPLIQPAALELFAERAAGVRPGFRLTQENSATVAEICRLLDGLPLAIELAAAGTRLLPPPALLSRVRERLDVPGTGPVDLPERQRTLRATMDWSYDLLGTAERALFARLSVFAGGCAIEAAEVVCGRAGEPDVLDTVSELLASSLLATSEDADPEPRLYMLQTVRAYAAEKLAASPDRAETERRHTEWVLNMLAEQLRVRGREHRRLFERLDHERANLRAVVSRAIQAGDVATIAQLARDALPYLAHRDREVEVVGWLDQALSQAEAAPPALRGRLLVLRALVATVFADFTKARSLLTAGRALLPNDDDHAYDRALATMADAYTAVADDPQRAPTAIDAAAEQFAALGIGLGRAYMEVTRGNLALHHGEMEKAAASYQTAVQLADDLGDNAMRGRALSLLGLTRLALGDVDGARVSVVHGARANRHGAQPTSMAYSLDGLAAIALASGRSAVAVRALSSAAAVRAQSGHPPSPAFSALLADLASRGREQLGTMAYAAAWSEAQEWKVEEALDRTLQGLEEPA